MYKYDIKHDHLIDLNKCLTNGQSYLTLLSESMNNFTQKASFLMDHGADPNKPDDNGVYFLALAIFNRKKKCIRTLLESNKIDLLTHIT